MRSGLIKTDWILSVGIDQYLNITSQKSLPEYINTLPEKCIQIFVPWGVEMLNSTFQMSKSNCFSEIINEKHTSAYMRAYCINDPKLVSYYHGKRNNHSIPTNSLVKTKYAVGIEDHTHCWNCLTPCEDEVVVCLENSYLAKPFLDKYRSNLNKFWADMGEKYKKRLKRKNGNLSVLPIYTVHFRLRGFTELIVGNLLWHIVNPRHDLNINKYDPWRFYAYFIKKYFINKEKIHKEWFYNRITSDEHYIESGSFTEEPVMENLPHDIHKIILENNGNLFGLFHLLGNREDPKIASFTHGPHTPHALHYSHQKLYPLKNMQISNWQYKYKITTYYFDTLIYNELKKYDITKEQILEVFNLNLKLRGLPVISKEMKETSDRIWFDSDSNKLSPKEKYDMEAEEAALKKIQDEKIVKEAEMIALKESESEHKSEHFSLTIAGRIKI